MKYILIVLMFPFLSASECGKHKKGTAEQQVGKEAVAEQVKDSIPVCIRDMIRGDKKEERPVQADEYLYKGKKVYLFTYGCCDNYNMLYDDSCKNICAASGGFSGKGDGKCPDFSTTAKYIKQIWKDSTR
jgi:hypothetical protein